MNITKQLHIHYYKRINNYKWMPYHRIRKEREKEEKKNYTESHRVLHIQQSLNNFYILTYIWIKNYEYCTAAISNSSYLKMIASRIVYIMMILIFSTSSSISHIPIKSEYIWDHLVTIKRTENIILLFQRFGEENI